ncbi:amidohydrolase [Caldimonas thermodepolymerans]|jgi:amidohydrolase|uniref:Amidohydrolase n=1 Tax=Caldimonas thermodepolymerans TaxID=215580 RepID=A0A2S5T1S9_9BURK|nr:M20 aminoacylase family protein [Caldimonas thermodepolymerans]PPE68975.1 amidohydrolase [Caldimonas thermodepolymerans]QPC32276.1 amidohydrolase [Caldimonas thermodepolymerans]RDH98172.1 hippurate hydrolase [Caldimonas thermodepolymerans]TCP08052.1 hippurate hydrolase [Caldimonas thermodepolymerans]UZG45077.1 M20 family metallopeptidase [Caldimonas thermodepolymerans]
MQLIESILKDAAAIAATRRDIHAHPELCFEEERTADLIAAKLTEWGIPVHRGLGKTGVVGVVRNGTSPRAIGLRADIDALPITEHNQFAHASRHPGKMHACGHDGHTAMLLAAAKYLAQHRDFDGTVYLVFQPAEEGGGGAREMIRDGLFERFPMEAMFGMHNWPGLKVGQFAIRNGPCFASSNEFCIRIRGKGAHAAMPHLGVDPVPVACQMVQAFQTIISRNKRPIDAGVISVTMIHTGEATNVVPDYCEIQGTVRTFTIEVLDLIEQRMRTIAQHTAAAFECECEFEFARNYPPTINHPAETEFARRVMAEVVGPENVLEFEPTMGAEDFSYFLLEKPGAYFVIGNGDGDHRDSGHGMGPCMLHNPSYDFNDELIPLGATLWVRLAERWLAPQGAA